MSKLHGRVDNCRQILEAYRGVRSKELKSTWMAYALLFVWEILESSSNTALRKSHAQTLHPSGSFIPI